MNHGKVNKTQWYYTFWGIMSIAVVLGQIYVGLGYRLMSKSIFATIEQINQTTNKSPEMCLQKKGTKTN